MNGPSPRFATTRWSMVRDVAGDDAPRSRAALAALCQMYWYPLYAYARRRGADAHTAQDHVQDFLTTLIEKGYVERVDPERGRFRTFLLVAFRRHLAKLRERAGAQKRGGDVEVLALDFERGEERYRLEPAHLETAERVFERRWALTILERALDALREEFRQAGREDRFDVLRVYLEGGTAAPSHEETAERLALTSGAVKVAVHRLRGQYRARLRHEIAQTVDDDADIDAEIRVLMSALAG